MNQHPPTPPHPPLPLSPVSVLERFAALQYLCNMFDRHAFQSFGLQEIIEFVTQSESDIDGSGQDSGEEKGERKGRQQM